MVIKKSQITIKDLVKDFNDRGEDGCTTFGGRLIVRPEYQREFVYNEKQQYAVIETIDESCPIGCFYWAKTGEKDSEGKDIYEVMDGQQRIISIGRYISEAFKFNGNYFRNCPEVYQERILNYPISIYVFEGDVNEKLKWFKRINIAGKQLSSQELFNAIYCGPFISDARSFFSKTGCYAKEQYTDYITGTPIQQEILETAISWRANSLDIDNEEYLRLHRDDADATDLKTYYMTVLNWAKNLFNPMRGITEKQDWGELYDEYHTESFTKIELANQAKELIEDDDVKNHKGIIKYILSGRSKECEKLLNLRTFDQSAIRRKLSLQGNVCAICGEAITLREAEGDHITPWCEGGKTEDSNLQVLCKTCNRTKGAR